MIYFCHLPAAAARYKFEVPKSPGQQARRDQEQGHLATFRARAPPLKCFKGFWEKEFEGPEVAAGRTFFGAGRADPDSRHAHLGPRRPDRAVPISPARVRVGSAIFVFWV